MMTNIFSDIAMLNAYQTYTKANNIAKKSDQAHNMSFDMMVQNKQMRRIEQTDHASAVAPLISDEEMLAFKQEIYDELAEIDKMHSSATLSNSVHITEDGFKKMKEDPDYRKEIMDWLRADARASYGVPFAVHITTTITGAGATCYGANVYYDDSPIIKVSKKQIADKKAEGAFYYSDRTYDDYKTTQNKNDKEYHPMGEYHNLELMQMMMYNNIYQEMQQQAIYQMMFNQPSLQNQYLDNYMLGMSFLKNWNI